VGVDFIDDATAGGCNAYTIAKSYIPAPKKLNRSHACSNNIFVLFMAYPWESILSTMPP